MQNESVSYSILQKHEGVRLDVFLCNFGDFHDKSRSLIQRLIRGAHVKVNSSPAKTGYRLRVNDIITVKMPPQLPSDMKPEDIAFDILFEDDFIVVLSKPPGVVVHPAAGNSTGTLVHGLLFHCEKLSSMSGEDRPGIVHRLDRDTSGVMVVAKNDLAHRILSEQFKGRKIEKKYRAILDGVPRSSEGKIDSPIGRHSVHRKKMAVLPERGRHALTSWRVVETFGCRYAYVELGLETGRTHQIRVHMASLGHPVAGDSLYGKKNDAYERLMITRQCLHSFSLRLQHPASGEQMYFRAPLWPDMEETLLLLRGEVSGP